MGNQEKSKKRMSSDTPLSSVPGWSKALVDALSAHWITTAEQVVAIAATAEGVGTLTTHLGVSEHDMRQLLDSARAALPPALLAELERVDVSQYGLGALPPDENK
jgi:hypothetical protein